MKAIVEYVIVTNI